MKKFILKFFIFSFIVTMPVAIITSLYSHTNYYYTSSELYWIKHHPDNIDLLNLGNSHAVHAFRYVDKYNGTAHNFASSSQPFYYDYQILKHVSKDLNENAVVIIPVSIYDWYYNVADLFTEDKYNYNKRYYKVLNPTEMYNFNIDDYVNYGLLSGLTAKENLKYIRDDIAEPTPDSINNDIVEDIVSVADYKEESWKNEIIKIDEETKNFNIKYFNKTIEYCYKKGFTPVIVTMPITGELNKRFSNDYQEDIQDILEQQLLKYPDITFFDYANDDNFTQDYSLYKDSDHLNSIGGDKFTYKLLNNLVDNNLINEDNILQ